MAVRYFGASVERIEDPDLVTGRGRYVDDIDLPGALEAAFVRSPHAHARIRRIDTSAAKATPGIIAVFTAADLGVADRPMPQFVPAPVIVQDRTQFVLATDAVRYVGEPIVLVIAENRAVAEDAAATVEIDYEPLPAVTDLATALSPDAPRAHEGAPDNRAGTLKSRFGNPDEVFAKAAHVFRETIHQHRGGCHSMECRGVLASVDPLSGQLTILSSTQAPYMIRRLFARWLGIDESQMRVAAPHVGGGFGPKAVIYPEEFAIPLAARALGRPVKWIEDRREHFVSTTQQRDQIWDLEVAADKNGRMLAIRGHCRHDAGAYLPYGFVLAANTMATFPGPYALEALDISLDVTFTNMVASTPVRGAGRPYVAFVLERLADAVARGLKIDRAEVRRQSFVRKDQFPYQPGTKARDGSPVTYDSGDFHACLDAALKRMGDDFRARQEKLRNEGRYIGLGLSSCIEDTGMAPFEGATVSVQPNGKVMVATGAAGQGQGHPTIFAQIAADALGIAIENVSVVSADTAAFPLGIGTVGSRVAVTGGSSVHLAATQVREKAIKVAAEMLEAAEADLTVEDGAVRVAGTDKAVKLGEIALKLAGFSAIPMPRGVEPGLSATAYHEARGTTFASGTNACEVEVDIATGAVKILRYVVAHDCGKLINPMLVDGQIRGGVVHGIGNALYERMVYDEAGQPVTMNYGEYLLPVATGLPRIEIVHLETPSPLNPLGVKGAGEGGTIPAAACIISAIEDALAPFNVLINKAPLSPEDIVNMIDAGRA